MGQNATKTFDYTLDHLGRLTGNGLLCSVIAYRSMMYRSSPTWKSQTERLKELKRYTSGEVCSGGSRICKRGVGARSSAESQRSILSLKMATFSAFWALFLQFILHSSIDCLKRFRRQKPLFVGKLAVVCADSSRRQNKRVGNYVVFLCKGKLAVVWRGGIAPSSQNFSILSLKMATFSAFWALAHVARGARLWPLPAPFGSASRSMQNELRGSIEQGLISYIHACM